MTHLQDSPSQTNRGNSHEEGDFPYRQSDFNLRIRGKPFDSDGLPELGDYADSVAGLLHRSSKRVVITDTHRVDSVRIAKRRYRGRQVTHSVQHSTKLAPACGIIRIDPCSLAVGCCSAGQIVTKQ
jgi:hypothetical protein